MDTITSPADAAGQPGQQRRQQGQRSARGQRGAQQRQTVADVDSAAAGGGRSDDGPAEGDGAAHDDATQPKRSRRIDIVCEVQRAQQQHGSAGSAWRGTLVDATCQPRSTPTAARQPASRPCSRPADQWTGGPRSADDGPTGGAQQDTRLRRTVTHPAQAPARGRGASKIQTPRPPDPDAAPSARPPWAETTIRATTCTDGQPRGPRHMPSTDSALPLTTPRQAGEPKEAKK
ncbi:hypothetical protein GCM10028783_39740 [Modestobacter muralis]